PTGLGFLLAMGWGWRALFRDKGPIPAEQRDRHLKLMWAWAAGLAVQLAAVGYVCYQAPANKGLTWWPFATPPVEAHVAVTKRNQFGTFYRVRLENTSTVPLHHVTWRAFPDETTRLNEDKRKLYKASLIEVIPPGGAVDLPGDEYWPGYQIEIAAPRH